MLVAVVCEKSLYTLNILVASACNFLICKVTNLSYTDNPLKGDVLLL